MYALNAALPRNLANAAVAVTAVLGSRSAEMSTTRSLITHGSRVFGLANVRNGQTEFYDVYCVGRARLFLLCIIHGILTIYPVTTEATDTVNSSRPGALSPEITAFSRGVTTSSAHAGILA